MTPTSTSSAGGKRRGFVVGVMLLLATVFFVWGSFAERSVHHDANAVAPSGGAAANGESAAHRAAEGGGSEGTGAVGSVSESGEYRPLGFNLESTPLLLGGAAVSALLAGLVIVRPRREVLIVVAMLALVFTALEVAEIAHQIDANKTGFVVLALLAGILHALTAGLAIGVLFAKPPSQQVAVTG